MPGHGPFSAQLGAYAALVRPCYHGACDHKLESDCVGRFNALHGRLEEKLPEVMSQKSLDPRWLSFRDLHKRVQQLKPGWGSDSLFAVRPCQSDSFLIASQAIVLGSELVAGPRAIHRQAPTACCHQGLTFSTGRTCFNEIQEITSSRTLSDFL